MGAPWARHAICESALSVYVRVSIKFCKETFSKCRQIRNYKTDDDNKYNYVNSGGKIRRKRGEKSKVQTNTLRTDWIDLESASSSQ